MRHPVDFYFDFSCPYAYLASTQLAAIERDTTDNGGAAEVRLRPFLLGGVFRHLRQSQNMSTVLNTPKKRHNRMDLIRWADWFGAPLNTPAKHPNRTVEALRALLASPEDRWRDVVDAFFAVYWRDQRDISDTNVLRETLDSLDLDGTEIVASITSPAIKQQLRDRTDEAISVGVFGAPAWVVNGQLFWGQDRIEMVKRATTGWRPTENAAFDFNQDT